MADRPILFSAPMVRALLAGTKTQTRRVLKEQPQRDVWPFPPMTENDRALIVKRCPHGAPGDKLWVRETHAIVPRTAYRCSEGVQQILRPDDDHDAAIFREGWSRSRSGFSWKPSIHMPRWASRITLNVTGVRVERLQAISEADAMDEGAEPILVPPDGGSCPHVEGFEALWKSINGAESWDANPYVWVVEFERAEG